MRERFPRFEIGAEPRFAAAPMVHSMDRNPEPEAETMGLLQEYFQTVRRYKWTLLGCGLAGVLVSVLAGLRTLPVYQSKMSLEFRQVNGDFLNQRNVNMTSSDSGPEGDTNLQTQMRLMESQTTLRNTMERVAQGEHPAFLQRNDLLSQMQRGLHLGRPEPIPFGVALEEAAKNVKVKPLGVTRLVEITCESWSPELAARFCNEMETTFQDNDMETRSSEASKTSAWLTKQVADVKVRAQETEARLNTALGGNGLALNPNNDVGESRLRALQDELVKAQADRIAKEAEAGMDRTAAPGTTPEVLDSPAHRQYEGQLADLRAQLAKMTPTLTEENPKVKILESQLRAAEDGMRMADATSLTRQNNELSSARHREALLNVTYAAELAKVSNDLQRAAKVSLLRSEMDSEQQLYQTLLQRAKEAGFASAMQASTMRVVDPAQAAKVPFSPNRNLAAGCWAVSGRVVWDGVCFLS